MFRQRLHVLSNQLGVMVGVHRDENNRPTKYLDLYATPEDLETRIFYEYAECNFDKSILVVKNKMVTNLD